MRDDRREKRKKSFEKRLLIGKDENIWQKILSICQAGEGRRIKRAGKGNFDDFTP